jgi:putative lipase involved disintegration of autophagic bodies
LTGHSLGGSLAEYVGIKNGFRCETFNAVSTPIDMIAVAITGV